MELSTEIRNARQHLGLTGIEAAKVWGINPRTLQNWEQGRNQPKGFALQAFRAILAAAMEAKPAAPASSASPGCAFRPSQAKAPARAPQSVAVAPPAPLALTLRITRERMAVFATLATIEQRPLDEVIAECLADMAAHLTRTRSRLHLDEADRVSLERYLDSLERDEEERTARAGITSAMLAVAAASDAREAFPHFHDDEEADFARRCAGAGHVESTLAMEGC